MIFPTNKICCYKYDDIYKFVQLCDKYADENGIDSNNLIFRVTPKILGVEALFNKKDNTLLSYDVDDFGIDVSFLLDKNMVIIGDNENNNLSGNIVVFSKHYKNSTSNIKHSKDYIVDCKKIKMSTDGWFKDKNIHFIVLNSLNGLSVNSTSLLYSLRYIAEILAIECPYLTNGVFVQVVDVVLNKLMGYDSLCHLMEW